MKQIFKIVVVMNFFVISMTLLVSSCGGSKEASQEQQFDSTSVDFDPNYPPAVPDSTAVDEDYTTYCCGNHSPSHCGSVSQLDELEKQNNCKDFSSI